MKSKILLLCLTMGLLVFPLQITLAQCGTENGPVITAAKEVLKTNIDLVLTRVKKQEMKPQILKVKTNQSIKFHEHNRNIKGISAG